MPWTQTTTSWPLAATPEVIFAALTDAARLRQWFAEHAEVELRVGGAYRFWGKHTLGAPTATDATQEITELVPNERLGFTWNVLGVPSQVLLTLASDPEKGTTITAEQTVDRAFDLPRQRELIDDWWRLAFGNLAVHLGMGTTHLRPDFADPAPEIRLSVTIAAPPDVVFRTLIEPELLNQWAGSTNATVEPTVGGVYSYGWVYQIDGRTVHGGPTQILDLVPNERLVIDWPDWRGDTTVTGQTVTFTLIPEDGGTRLELVHAGFTRAADISDYPFGWGHFLGEITRVVMQGAGSEGE